MVEPARRAELADLLRQCVQCGLCLPHCATWLETGNEVQSPRGRLVLLNEVLATDAADIELDAAFLSAFDQCIGCRACETACPSGVPFDLLEYGQGLALSRMPGRAQPAPAVPPFVLRRLDHTTFLRWAGRCADLVRGIVRAVAGRDWRRRLDRRPARLGALVRLLGTMPRSPQKDEALFRLLDSRLPKSRKLPQPSVPTVPAAASEATDPPSIAFFAGCANRALLPGTSRRLLELLEAAGCDITIPAGQDCCGALAFHTGSSGRAQALLRRNREAFASADGSRPRILVEAAGCGLELKEKLGAQAGQVDDAVDLLSGLRLPAFGAVPLRVVVHDPCHARHGQGIYAQPRALLSRIPALTVLEAAESEVCCGSGGAWGLRHGELSANVGRRKAKKLAATGADLVVTSNPGCLGQIADGLAVVAPELPVILLTDLLWFAWKRGAAASLAI